MPRRVVASAQATKRCARVTFSLGVAGFLVTAFFLWRIGPCGSFSICGSLMLIVTEAELEGRLGILRRSADVVVQEMTHTNC